ncbi:GGDEF domain-containing protein [Paraburkholderia mimosarum]|uniref:GGDEF domain-containing protein n=2 Tax=Paraburkholderia mimosarum TaxID=312026 RepID=UPI001590D5D8|nr:GGDEF domain-containing protein [Paraburkholderia mimosarum]
MKRSLFARTSLGSRFVLGVSVALAPILVLCCWLLVHQWLVYLAANHAMRGFDAFRAALLAMEQVSAERGPMNGVLGEDLPIPAARTALLEVARGRSDARLAQLLAMLRRETSPTREENVDLVLKLQADLASARRNVDQLVALPRSWRGDQTTQGAVNRMISLIPEILPVVFTEMSVATKGDPDVFDTMLVAKLTADLREQAGQLGSRFTSALAMHRTLTDDELLAIELSRGRIEQLRALIDLRMLDHPAATAEAFATMSSRYFGDGERYVSTVRELATHPGGAHVSTGRFAEQYVPTMLSITQLRDVLLAETQGRLRRHLRSAMLALAGAIVAVVVLLGALAWLILMFRREVVRPFALAARVIRAIAKGDLAVEIPSSHRHEEIGELFEATHVLRQYSVERAQLETERGQLIRELATMADTDPLTRLLNRRAFERRARALLDDTGGASPRVALLMFDVDHFKRINDSYGHGTGDEALRVIAELCRTTARQSDVVARVGGEEFAVLVALDDAQLPVAAALAERLRQRIGEAVVIAD